MLYEVITEYEVFWTYLTIFYYHRITSYNVCYTKLLRDAQLSLAQAVPVTAGITVTTPQEVSLDDSRRSLDMFKKLHIPTAGIIENMSGFICPSCDAESDIFGMGTCEELAKQYDTQVLSNLPIEPAIREGGDAGKPIVYFNPESVSAKRYMEAAARNNFV